MIHLNQPLYSPESGPTGQQRVEKVNRPTALRKKIETLAKNIADAEAGIGKIPSASKLQGWRNQKADLEALAGEAVEGGEVKKTADDTSKVEVQADEPESVKIKHLQRLEEKVIDANQAIADAHQTGKSSIGTFAPKYSKGLVDRDAYNAEIDFIKAGGAVEDWKKTPQYSQFQARWAEVELEVLEKELEESLSRQRHSKQDDPRIPDLTHKKIVLDAKIQFLKAGGNITNWDESAFIPPQPESSKQNIQDQVPTMKQIEVLEGNPAKTDLPTLEANRAALKVMQNLLDELFKTARATGDGAAEAEVKSRKIALARALANIEIAIVAKTPIEAEIVDAIPTNETLAQKQARKTRLQQEIAEFDRKISELKQRQPNTTQRNSTQLTDLLLDKRKKVNELDNLNSVLAKESSNSQQNKSDTETVKTPDQSKDKKKEVEAKLSDNQKRFLEEIADGHAIYGKSLEHLKMRISADGNNVSNEDITSAEEELRDLFALIDAAGIKELLDLTKEFAQTDDIHRQTGKIETSPYVRRYLEHIYAIVHDLNIQIKHPENIGRDWPTEEEINTITGTRVVGGKKKNSSPLETTKFSDLSAQILRFIALCKDNKISRRQKKSEKPDKKTSTPVTPPTPSPTTPTPAPTPSTPGTPPPIPTPRTPGTPPPIPGTPPPIPGPTPPPIPTPRAPGTPPPLPPTLKIENIVIFPAVVRPDIENDEKFAAWYGENQEIFDAERHEPYTITPRALDDWYAQYQDQLPTLNKTRQFLADGKLDKALGIQSDNLESTALQGLRDKAFQKLQYSLFEGSRTAKFEGKTAAREALDRILASVEKSKENANTIKELEAKVAARERILNLGRKQKAETADVIELVIEDKPQFMRDNIDTVQAFLDDMRNNFQFYAEAAPTLKADGAKDKIFKRYAAARGKDSLKAGPIGFLGRVGVRVKEQLNKLNIFKKAGGKILDVVTRSEMSQAQEDKNSFWNMVEVLRKHQLVPSQTGRIFREGAVVQAGEKVDLLQKYINAKFNNAPTSLPKDEEEKAAKMFEDLYDAYVKNKTQSMDYQDEAKRIAKKTKVETAGDMEDISNLNTNIDASEDWVARAMGSEQPELISEVKNDLFILEADNFADEMSAIRVNDKPADLREAGKKLDTLRSRWYAMAGDVEHATPEITAKIKATHLICANKTQELELMKIKKGVNDPRARLHEVVTSRTEFLKNIDTAIMSPAEKLAAAREVIRTIEQRLNQGGFNAVTRRLLVEAKDRLAATTF